MFIIYRCQSKGIYESKKNMNAHVKSMRRHLCDLFEFIIKIGNII